MEEVKAHTIRDQITLLKFGRGTSLTHMQVCTWRSCEPLQENAGIWCSESSQSRECLAATPTCPPLVPGIGANLSAFLPRWAAMGEFFLEISATLMDMQCNSTDHSKICFIFKIKITLTLDCSDFVSVNPENHFKHIVISITLPFSNYVKSSCSSLKGTAVQIGLVVLTNDIYVWK